jgi:predicted esterase
VTGYPATTDEYINNLNTYFDQESLMAQADMMRTLVHLESQRFDDKNTSRVFIGGFSQGSDLALSIFLQSTVQLGGVFGLSGMVPLE